MSSFELKKSILAEICYFDIFNYPLTLVEIEKWLYNLENPAVSAVSKLKISETMSGDLKDATDNQEGFYFLKGKSSLIKERKNRYLIAERKFKKGLGIAKLIALIPFVRLIAVCNTLGFSNAREDSDIDFFIITSPQRIWFVRFFSVFLTKILGLRPTGQEKKDKICLSFFISQDNLSLKNIALKNDVYLAYWLTQLTPIFDEEETYERFLRSNLWVREYLPNFIQCSPVPRRSIKLNRFFSFLKSRVEKLLLGKLGDLFEKTVKQYQLKILPNNLKNLANQPGFAVVINDKMLKFHDSDRRAEYREQFERRLASLLGGNL